GGRPAGGGQREVEQDAVDVVGEQPLGLGEVAATRERRLRPRSANALSSVQPRTVSAAAGRLVRGVADWGRGMALARPKLTCEDHRMIKRKDSRVLVR
ncbi:hypothetical protein ABZ672_55075, partial [Streptomyces mirabilis]